MARAGDRGEAAEQVNSQLSAFAPALASMSETQFRLSLGAWAAGHNHRRNVDAPRRLMHDLVRFLQRVQRSVAEYDAAVVAYPVAPGGAVPTDADVDAWAASRSRSDELGDGDGNADDARQQQSTIDATRLVQARSEHDALDSVLRSTVAAVLAAGRAGARRRPDAYAADAFFLTAAASCSRVAALMARRVNAKAGEAPVTDVASARARLAHMAARITIIESKVGGSSSALNVDPLIVNQFRKLHDFASVVSKLTPPAGVAPAVCEWPVGVVRCVCVCVCGGGGRQ